MFFVALETTRDPRLVPALIADALDVRESATQSLLDAVKAYCREKRLLLVLDNFEHLLEVGPLVTDLLTSCPRLTVLVTSRAVLRVSGEREYPVPTLALPDLSALENGHRADPQALLACESVSLFVDRARAVRPDFELTEESAVAVAEICRRLDGLPLAIELAAARIRLFPPSALLQRLDNRLKVLTGGARDLPPRQQTLRGALDWSYELLGQDERAARLLGAADGMLDAIGAQLSPNNESDYRRTVEALIAQLGEEQVKEERSRGGALSESEAIAVAQSWVAEAVQRSSQSMSRV